MADDGSVWGSGFNSATKNFDQWEKLPVLPATDEEAKKLLDEQRSKREKPKLTCMADEIQPRTSDWIYPIAVLAAGCFITALAYPHLDEAPGRWMFGVGVMVAFVGSVYLKALGAAGKTARAHIKEE